MDNVLPLSMVSNGHDIRQDNPPNLFETDANKVANHQPKLSRNLRASPSLVVVRRRVQVVAGHEPTRRVAVTACRIQNSKHDSVCGLMYKCRKNVQRKTSVRRT